MKRRKFMRLGVAGGALGVMSPFGGALLPSTSGALELPEGAPSRLLTIYMPGGWMPSMFFSPLRDRAMTSLHWPSYLSSPEEIENLDGSGDAPNDDDPTLPRIRVPAVWDESLMSSASGFNQGGTWWPDVDPRRSYGYSFRHYGLAEDTCVVAGVDQQTAEHFSGRQAELSGIAGARFSVQAMHCVAAHAHALAGTDRPLGAVTIKTGGPGGSTPTLSRVDLPAHAAATTVGGIGSIARNFSDQTPAWDGLRHRDATELADYLGEGPQSVPLTRMDQYALSRFARFRGLGDDSVYEKLYEAHSGLSRKFALDLVSRLQATPGWESELPHWVSGSNPYQCSVGRVYGDNGQTWSEQFELVLKLFKADACTAINVQCPAHNGEGFDIHASGESAMRDLFNRTRSSVEVIGRLLGEMKNTPIGGGKSLLDDTLVLLVSEFGRSWPQLSTSNGHWPFTSYVFVGGGVQGNRMIGGYDLSPTEVNNPTGVEVPVEGGRKHPAARDIARTVYRIMGIPDETLEIFGGPAEILGVRAGT